MNRYGEMLCHIVVAGAALAAVATPANGAEPFKITNIHFETNASACDMGIQISFDTDGVSEGSVKDPNGQIVYQFGAVGGPGVTHDVTEGFQERVEPQIIDLRACARLRARRGRARNLANRASFCVARRKVHLQRRERRREIQGRRLPLA